MDFASTMASATRALKTLDGRIHQLEDSDQRERDQAATFARLGGGQGRTPNPLAYTSQALDALQGRH